MSTQTNVEKLEQFNRIERQVESRIQQLLDIAEELRGQLKPTSNGVGHEPRENTYRQFCDQHGGESQLVNVGGNRMSFSDGACVEGNSSFYRIFDPPTDPLANNHARRDFALALLVRAERDFAQLKTAAIGGLAEDGSPAKFNWPVKDYGPAPTELDQYGQPCAEAALRKLQSIVFERREKLKAIEAEPVAVKEREAKELAMSWKLQTANERQVRRGRLDQIEI